MKVVCPYCQTDAVLTDSAEVYHGRSYGMIWLCRPCNAYVGVHKNSKNHAPLGRLANAELREWKVKAHAAFDPIWRMMMIRERISKSQARKKTYLWLGSQLRIAYPQCHIGMFDVDQCKRVVEICGEKNAFETH